MKRQGYNDRLDESLGMRNRGPHRQSMKSRRHESEGEERRETGHAYMGDRSMDREVRKMHRDHMMDAHNKFMSRLRKKGS